MKNKGIWIIINKLYQRWKCTLFRWALSAITSWIIVTIWGVETLLSIFLIIFGIAYIITRYDIANWAQRYFWKYIRGMVIFSILPAIWPIIKEMLTNFSLSLLIELILAIGLVIYIWASFDKMMQRLMIKKLKG